MSVGNHKAQPQLYSSVSLDANGESSKLKNRVGSFSIDSDTVHFTSLEFFARESEGKAVLEVIRIGEVSGSCRVTYRTEDRSGVAGERYEAAVGTVEFEPGEALKTFEIALIQSDTFDTTLEFVVTLESPDGCELGHRLKQARVSVLDDDRFPTDEIADKIVDPEGNIHAEGLGVQLLLAWMSFAFTHVPTIWWKSLSVVVLDQFHNAYYMCSIFMRVYLVDHVLNLHSDPEMLIVPGNRSASVLVLAACWTAPNAFLLFIDYAQVGPLDMGFTLRKFLRVNFVRTYLNYTDHSLRLVPVHDLVETSASLIPTIVENGYLFFFDMLRSFGKICCVGVFMMMKDPSCALPLLVFPATMIAFAACTQNRMLELAEHASEQQEVTQSLLVRASLSLSMIKDYMMRSSIVDNFEDQLGQQRDVTIQMNKFKFWMEQVVPWVSLLSLGSYMIYGSLCVLEGQISVGVFLATMNAYGDLGARFQFLNSKLAGALGTVEPLMQLTKYMNLETDLEGRLVVNRKQRDFIIGTISRRRTSSWGPPDGSAVDSTLSKSFFDGVRIHFEGDGIEHVKSLSNLHVKVRQDTITLISGPHGCGKSTLLSMFSKTTNQGDVSFMPFLFCLQVSNVPDVITHMNLLENLCYGSSENLDRPERVRRIFKHVLLGKRAVESHWLLDRLESDIAAHESGNDFSISLELWQDIHDTEHTAWHKKISNNEKRRIHLARAFIFNPNIMVLHKPCDDVDTETVSIIMELLREFVEERGLECDAHSLKAARHPRTVFLTSALGAHRDDMDGWVDYHWFFDREALRFDAGGYSKSTRLKIRTGKNRMLL